ncbi:pyridoxamine 5'-phosphate oxidase family protein [Streptomyces sp. NPDC055013]
MAARAGPGRPPPRVHGRSLLGPHGVGRIALSTASGPVVVPVNYSVVDGAIVFRAASNDIFAGRWPPGGFRGRPHRRRVQSGLERARARAPEP